MDACAINEPTLIVQPYLYLGSAHAVHNVPVLEHLGITHVLNVSAESPVPDASTRAGRKIVTKHIMADDTDLYNMRYHFDEAFAFIDEGRRHGNVFVHCDRGQSRAPTIVVAYLMHRYRLSLCKAYEEVRCRRPYIQPSTNFMRQLAQYEAELAHGRTPKGVP